MKQYADRIMAVVNNIKLLGEEFADNKAIEEVIKTLLERCESNISSLEDSRDLSVISISKLINTLKASRHNEHTEEEVLRALSIEGWSKRKEKLMQDGGKKKYSPCSHCKKNTHPEKYC
ncbi:pleiotropic drug resistance protein 3-like [Gossypium australe]|uniref:Pleiotropic drug resistance protein 3-like n=1 Tax=Gossypium australe TaxID=47621 RepID=A0A5B6V8H8_9ROSI|nr:pleiotropic drug resistance protein 3-like [Gossypium australe]